MDQTTGIDPDDAAPLTMGYADIERTSAQYHTVLSPSQAVLSWDLYDPAMGRWAQEDPVPGSVADPKRVNRYAYAGNDPVNNTDPSGYIDIGFSPVTLCSGLPWGE
jgi:hypothetical protein